MFDRRYTSERLVQEINTLTEGINTFKYTSMELPTAVKELNGLYFKLLKNDTALLEDKGKSDADVFVLTTLNKVRQYELIDKPALDRLQGLLDHTEAKHLSSYLDFVAARSDYLRRVKNFLIIVDKEIDFRKNGVHHHEKDDRDDYDKQYGYHHQPSVLVNIQKKIAPMTVGRNVPEKYTPADTVKPEVLLDIYIDVVKLLMSTEKQKHHKYMSDFYTRAINTVKTLTYKTIDPTAKPVAEVAQIRRK